MAIFESTSNYVDHNDFWCCLIVIPSSDESVNRSKKLIRVVVVEDQIMVRGLFELQCKEWNYDVVGLATSVDEAIAIILESIPDIVILDVHLPDGSGLSVVDRVRKTFPRLKFLAVSGFTDDLTLVRLGQAKVDGFVYKGLDGPEILHRGLDMIIEGKTFFSENYIRMISLQRRDPGSFLKMLTPRECMVLSLIGEGLTDDQISVRLAISPRTAQTHRTHILRKLHIESSPQLVAFAREHGFGNPAFG